MALIHTNINNSSAPTSWILKKYVHNCFLKQQISVVSTETVRIFIRPKQIIEVFPLFAISSDLCFSLKICSSFFASSPFIYFFIYYTRVWNWGMKVQVQFLIQSFFGQRNGSDDLSSLRASNSEKDIFSDFDESYYKNFCWIPSVYFSLHQLFCFVLRWMMRVSHNDDVSNHLYFSSQKFNNGLIC